MTATGYGFRIDLSDTPESLQALYDHPDTRWYAKRRLRALAASGALIGATGFEALHPRGKDGKFIDKFGWVRWLDKDTLHWQQGWVRDIDQNSGMIKVKQGDQTIFFPDAHDLYAQPKRKARLTLPNVIKNAIPEGWKKTGGKGGSNPGGFFQVDVPTGTDPPDLGPKAGLPKMMRTLGQGGFSDPLSVTIDAPADHVVGGTINVVTVPRVDGTKNRSDVLYRMGAQWYRVPSTGSMTVDDTLRDDLKVSPEEAFGLPGSERRLAVINDQSGRMITLSDEFNVEDLASTVQVTGANLPASGDSFYVKTMNIPERANNEALANHLYEMLGVPVPEVSIGGDGVTVASKIVPGKLYDFNPNNPAHVKAAQQGFVADAFLANWDVVGLSYDNMKVDEDGVVWRIDAGGALAYRAQGAPKGSHFGPDVTELVSLSDKKINHSAGSVFSGMTQAELKEQARLVQAIDPVELQAVADEFGMPELGPVLIARRQSILDQLGVWEPPITPPSPLFQTPAAAPKVEGLPYVAQVSTGPHVQVDNYQKMFDSETMLPTVTFKTSGLGDAERDAWIKNAVFKKNGDLYTYHSEFKPDAGDPHGTTTFKARNLLTGRIDLVVVDNDDKALVDWQRDSPDLDNLVDDLSVQRQLAIDEIVGVAHGDSWADVMGEPDKYSDAEAFQVFGLGIANMDALRKAWDRGALGKTGPEGSTDWPLATNDGALYEITGFGDDGVRVRRRDAWETDETTMNEQQFAMVGPWLRPGNDTTAAVWKDRYAEDPDAAVVGNDWAGNPMTQADVDEFNAGQSSLHQAIFDHNDDGDPDTPQPVDDVDDEPDWAQAEAEAEAAVKEWQEKQLAGDTAANDELEALIQQEEAIAQAMSAAEPNQAQKLIHGIAAGLSPGEPLLSTEIDASDLDKLKADLIGMHVVVLPIAAHDNPDWEGKNLGVSNGLGTITDVTVQKQWVANIKAPGTAGSPGYQDVTMLKISRGNGQYSSVMLGDNAKFPKVIIPVEQEPLPQVPTFKKDGTIVVNGVVVGTHHKPYEVTSLDAPGVYHSYHGVIDGDHSLTGKPMQFNTNKSKSMKVAAGSLLVPIAPKVTKPKSTKVHATEADLKELNDKLYGIESQITAKHEALAALDLAESVTDPVPEMTPVGPVLPLADGTLPEKGDWLFSTVDGKYVQVVKTTVPAKGAQAPDYIRVKFQDPVTGQWKDSNRKRSTLVKANAPGEAPFTMETKAHQDAGGDWFGPGTTVHVQFEGGYSVGNALVLDTTTDGKVKLQNPDGSNYWIDKKAVYAPGAEAAKEGMPITTVGKLQSGGTGDANQINEELAALTDAHAAIAAQIAATHVAKPKTKKATGTPYPGPDGKHVKQPAHLAENREAVGLKNLKDGYAPAVGQILRHNDGSQYVVMEVGDAWSSHKNSVKVVPLGTPSGYYDGKWKAASTLVVDHDAMLTDGYGNPLPVVNQIDGADWSPTSGVLWRRDYTHTYYQTDTVTGKSEYRTKEMSKFYIVAPEGSVYNLDGTKVSVWNVAGSLNGAQKVAYIDKDDNAPSVQKLTVSIQPHHNAKVGDIEYAVIHDPHDSPGVILGSPNPDATGTVPEASDVLDNPDWAKVYAEEQAANAAQQAEFFGNQEIIDQGLAQGTSTEDILDALSKNVGPLTPETPAAPPQPLPPPAQTPGLPPPLPTPMEPDLPIFEGKNPSGTEVPHKATTKSSAGVPIYQSTGGTNLDVAGVPGARSVVAAIDETVSTAKSNKKNKEKKWVSTYGLADHDLIEDMMVQTQVVKDEQGNEFVEVRFRLETEAARQNHLTFITSSTNETGDWEFANRNSKNMVPGDLIAVRVASGGGVTIKGALRPDDASGAMPNATVIAAPVLVGKNKAGTYDVWRTQVLTANGEHGWIDLEDRNGTDSITISYWDETKPRMTNGNKDLNPNAKDQGWSVKSKSLNWDRATSSENTDERDSAGVKKIGGKSQTSIGGTGWTLQRDFQGAQIEYRTSSEKNSANGQVVIRVPVDDPEAQRKISEAMELVGVPKEKQAPPDKAALTKLATDKVWTQFNPTYTAGKRPNSPQDALDAIDNAVGKELGRKATMDDISLRISPDGRVQVMVSEDVSRAIVAKNGVKAYTHRFSGSFEQTVKGAVTGESPGLMATTERWSHGLFYFGMSSVADHGHDSADHLFLRMSKNNTSSQTHTAIIDPVAIHRHVGYYWQPHDSYGSRQSNQLNWLTPGNGVDNSSNELMIHRRLEADTWGHVIMSDQERTKMINELHAQGVTHAPNGLPLEDFFVTSGGAAALPKKLPSFGDEVTLGSLPDTGMPATTPAMAGV